MTGGRWGWRWWLVGGLAAVAAVTGYLWASDDETSPSTSRPTSPSTSRSAEAPPRSFAVPGVHEAALRVTTSDGREVVGCVLVADTPDERARGLMEVTDLGEHDGMAFLFEGDSTGGFWMRNTPTPLTIAYYDAAGAFVAANDMEPCEDSPRCPSYPAPGRPYRVAIEVPKGRAPALGLTPGSVGRVGGACT